MSNPQAFLIFDGYSQIIGLLSSKFTGIHEYAETNWFTVEHIENHRGNLWRDGKITQLFKKVDFINP